MLRRALGIQMINATFTAGKTHNLVGVVLCGGQSSRMGSDKGLLTKQEDDKWVQYCYQLLSSMDIPVVVSVNPAQQLQYQSLFPSYKFVIDDTSLEAGGPLRGLLSVHEQYLDIDIFLLACDMVEMHPVVLQRLYDEYTNDTEECSFVFVKNDVPEPLCAIYTCKDINKIYQLLKTNFLQRHSMKYCIEKMAMKSISIPGEWEQYFTNYNTLPAQEK